MDAIICTCGHNHHVLPNGVGCPFTTFYGEQCYCYLYRPIDNLDYVIVRSRGPNITETLEREFREARAGVIKQLERVHTIMEVLEDKNDSPKM